MKKLLILIIVIMISTSIIAFAETTNIENPYEGIVTEPQSGEMDDTEKTIISSQSSFWKDPSDFIANEGIKALTKDSSNFFSLTNIFLFFTDGARAGLNSPFIEKVTRACQTIAMLFVAVMAMWIYLKREITEDDDNMPISIVIGKIVLTVATIYLVPYILGKIIAINDFFMSIISIGGQSTSIFGTDSIGQILASGLGIVLSLVFVIVTMVLLFFIYVSIAKRTLLLAIWLWIGPIASLSLIGQGSYFKKWLGMVLGCAIQPAAQLGIITIGNIFAMQITGGLGFVFTMIAAFSAAIGIPKVINSFVGSVGSGANEVDKTAMKAVSKAIFKI